MDEVLDNPLHPYTRGLIACVPHLQEIVSSDRPFLKEVPGMVPPLSQFGFEGCMFAPRCDDAVDQCWQKKPGISLLTDGHNAACWNLDGPQRHFVA